MPLKNFFIIILISFLLIIMVMTSAGVGDSLFMKNGDKIAGEVLNSFFTIQTPYARIVLQNEELREINFQREDLKIDLFLSISLEKFSGICLNSYINFRLPEEKEIVILKEKISKILFTHKRRPVEGRTTLFKMSNGDLFFGEIQEKGLEIETPYLSIFLEKERLKHIVFSEEGVPIVEITTKKGDIFQGTLKEDEIVIKLNNGNIESICEEMFSEINFDFSKEFATLKEETGLEEMVFIPAGEFLMGSNEGEKDESPLHSVYLDAYYIDKYEVTNEEYCRFLNEEGNRSEEGYLRLNIDDEDCRIEERGGKYYPKKGYERHPVVEVTWFGARDYAQWAGKRLPTEAEWEKAARGKEGKKYPWGDSLAEKKANYNSTNTLPVGSYPSGVSPYGCYDMAGNVWEWCSDWYNERYYENSPRKNPSGPREGSERVLRGGSFYNPLTLMYCANRFKYSPEKSGSDVGFRCAKSFSTGQ
ncbi:formylglycine-generating enzyme family protein [Candidatus Aerophobetes bacterium]|nr:formylglycine-generating enzyme family protein [Candidatus Aerophobetes bacterium]